MQDPLFLVKKHNEIGKGVEKNYSSIRLIYYPPLPESFDFSKLPCTDDNCYMRMNEHVDFGSITLVFPDPKVGGLQV